jgi:hypothetical protein
MRVERIEIGRLHLRVPGLTREEARRLGAEVVRQLARELPETQGLRPAAALHLRIRIAPEIQPGDMAARIAAAVVRGIAP